MFTLPSILNHLVGGDELLGGFERGRRRLRLFDGEN